MASRSQGGTHATRPKHPGSPTMTITGLSLQGVLWSTKIESQLMVTRHTDTHSKPMLLASPLYPVFPSACTSSYTNKCHKPPHKSHGIPSTPAHQYHPQPPSNTTPNHHPIPSPTTIFGLILKMHPVTIGKLAQLANPPSFLAIQPPLHCSLIVR